MDLTINHLSYFAPTGKNPFHRQFVKLLDDVTIVFPSSSVTAIMGYVMSNLILF
jgi:hypothetical protein